MRYLITVVGLLVLFDVVLVWRIWVVSRNKEDTGDYGE